MHLARLEVRLALEELVKRIDKFEAIEAPTWTRSNFICGVKKLHVRATRAA
jgi:cytochrome P450